MRISIRSALNRRGTARRLLTAFAVVAFLVQSPQPAWPQAAAGIAELHRSFAAPPASSRIMMRWWWFGPAAQKPEITRELEQMKAAGIGGVEIANLYPLELDDPATGFHNTSFLSKEHLAALSFAAQEAHRLGLRVDITLGSGWPFGGPHIPVTQSAGKLRIVSTDVPARGRHCSRASHRRRRSSHRSLSASCACIAGGTRGRATHRGAGRGPIQLCCQRSASPAHQLHRQPHRHDREARLHRRRGLRARSLRSGGDRKSSPGSRRQTSLGLRQMHRPTPSSVTASRTTAPTGHPRCSRSSSAAAATICARICLRSSQTPGRRLPRSAMTGAARSPNSPTRTSSRRCTPGPRSITRCCARRFMDIRRSRSRAIDSPICLKGKGRRPS